MLSESQAKKIVDFVLELCAKHSSKKHPAQAEVSITGSNVATSRFANNEVTQNQAPDITTVALRVLQDQRQVRLETLDLSDKGLTKLVESAFEAVKLLDGDDQILPLPSKCKKDKDDKLPVRYDKATAAETAAGRAQKVGEIISLAKASNLSAAGVYCTGANFEAIGNSNGLFNYYRESSCECSLTISKDGTTSWAKAHAPKAIDIKVKEMTERVIAKTIKAQNPESLAPGKYMAILERAAVLDLLCQLWWDFSATSHIDKLSCLLDKVGQKVFGDNVTIYDDVCHPLQCGSPFDGEGQARMSLPLVQKGVLTGLVHSRQSAAKMQTKSTGHALPQPTGYGEMPANIVVEGGTSTIQDMLSLVQGKDVAVLLTRVWYVREVDPATKLITGMTRDGTFLVQNGAIVKPIKNLRFNISLLDLLNNIVAMGPSLRTAGEEGQPAVVPMMLVRDFNFTEGTRF